MTEAPFEDRDANADGSAEARPGRRALCLPSLGPTDPERAAGSTTTLPMRNDDHSDGTDKAFRIAGRGCINALRRYAIPAYEVHLRSTGCCLPQGLPEHPLQLCIRSR